MLTRPWGLYVPCVVSIAGLEVLCPLGALPSTANTSETSSLSDSAVEEEVVVVGGGGAVIGGKRKRLEVKAEEVPPPTGAGEGGPPCGTMAPAKLTKLEEQEEMDWSPPTRVLPYPASPLDPSPAAAAAVVVQGQGNGTAGAAILLPVEDVPKMSTVLGEVDRDEDEEDFLRLCGEDEEDFLRLCGRLPALAPWGELKAAPV